MTTQAVTDIKELVGEMPARGCECELNTCGSLHRVDESCSGAAKWVVRIHTMCTLTGRHVDEVLALCEGCFSAIRGYVHKGGSHRCSCGMRASDWIGPVMPL